MRENGSMIRSMALESAMIPRAKSLIKAPGKLIRECLSRNNFLRLRLGGWVGAGRRLGYRQVSVFLRLVSGLESGGSLLRRFFGFGFFGPLGFWGWNLFFVFDCIRVPF